MKGNSIKEDIEIALDKFSNNKDINSAVLIVERFILGNYVLVVGGRRNIVKDSLRYILSDYKRVLKENETLKQDRNNNYQMIALSQNEMLGYVQGYEDGKKSRKSAVASILENQQYYIINRQIEKYKECIEKLQKENEEKRIILLAGAEKVKQLQQENSELKNKLDNSRKANEFLNTRNEELKKEKDVMYSKALNDIVARIDLDKDYISKQEANEYKKEIEQLHEQIDKMNSFTNDTIKKYNKFITELELNQEFQNFVVMENKK